MPRRKIKRVKRGHPVALIVGIHDDRAIFWRVFSESVRQDVIIKRNRKRKYQDDKQLYHFHEDIVNKLRPFVKEGIKSLLIVSPPKNAYSKEFLSHINKHHSWMLKKGENKAIFTEISGSANTLKEVLYLVRQDNFKEVVEETSNQETMLILEDLNEVINTSDSKILYTLKEIEKEIDKKWKEYEDKPYYIIITDEYLGTPKYRNRAHRILQIARNHGIKTKVVDVETETGITVKGYGGLICFTKKS
jgi:stalled ribosome rescue protein Dom34